MPSYIVTARDPRRIATAVTIYQLARPRFLLVVVVALVVFGGVGSFSGLSGTVGGIGIALVVTVLVTEFKRRQLARQLARHGFRTGGRIETSSDDTSLTVATAYGTAVYPFDQLADARVVRRVAVLGLPGSRSAIALPVELVPPAALST